MGIFGQIKNRRKTKKQRKGNQWKRSQKAEIKKWNLKVPELISEESTLLSKDLIKNKLKNPTNNIKLSNKKRNKLIKAQLRRQRERERAEADVDMTEVRSKKRRRKAAASASTDTVTSMDVEDCDQNDESLAAVTE